MPLAGARLAVIGCCGKTSLINLIAKTNRDKKVLIMTTTKIRPPREYGITLCDTVESCLAHKPHQGIQCLGVFHADTQKFTAPPQQHWPRLTAGYDIVLMEADGSRSLPCKGWSGTEPVIPFFTTHTIGVVTLLGLGKMANESTVHRLPEFCRVTGLSLGDMIGINALADMVGHPSSMFKNAVGTRVLLVNQIESPAGFEKAKEFAALLRQKHPEAVDKIFAGSVFENNWAMV